MVGRNEKCMSIRDRTEIQLMLERYASKILGDEQPPKIADTGTSKESTIPLSKDQNTGPTKPEIVVFQTRKSTTGTNSGTSTMRNTSRPIDKKSAAARKTPHHRSGVKEGPHSPGSAAVSTSMKFKKEKLNSSEVLKKLQFDVGSFGMKSFSKEKQREQERQRAIRLGAKAPKQKSVNYKLYIESRKRGNNETEDGNEPKQKNSRTGKKTLSQPKFWKEGNKTLNSQVGKYKNGVLKLSSKDISSIKKKR